MPIGPGKPCSFPLCPNLNCQEHKDYNNRQFFKRRKNRSDISPHKRGYSRRWAKARKGYLIKHPLCVHCLLDNIITLATEVDHIIPHRGDMKLFWNSKNWQGLCGYHHKVKTGKGK